MEISDDAGNARTLAALAVTRGIALLDDKGPEGWRSRIDLGRLNISMMSRCVITMVFGYSGADSFFEHMAALRPKDVADHDAYAAAHGFLACQHHESIADGIGSTYVGNNELRNAWIDALQPSVA